MQDGIYMGYTFKNSKSRNGQSKAILITAIPDVTNQRFVKVPIEVKGDDNVIMRVPI